MTFRNSTCKCFNCLYLLHWYRYGEDSFGNDNIKIHCMIPHCVKDREVKTRCVTGNSNVMELLEKENPLKEE